MSDEPVVAHMQIERVAKDCTHRSRGPRSLRIGRGGDVEVSIGEAVPADPDVRLHECA